MYPLITLSILLFTPMPGLNAFRDAHHLPPSPRPPTETQAAATTTTNNYADGTQGEWWACGKDLPSTPLITTRPLPSRRSISVASPRTSSSAPATAASAALPFVAQTAAAASMTSSRRGGDSGSDFIVGGGGGRGLQGMALRAVTDRRSRTIPERGSGTVLEPGSSMGEGRRGVGSGSEVGRQGAGQKRTERSTREESTMERRGIGTGVGEITAAERNGPSMDEIRSGSRRRRSRGSSGRARASIDRNRQRVMDLEVLISELLRRPEAFPHGGGGRGGGGVVRNGGTAREKVGGVQGEEVEEVEEEARRPNAIATDYHCVTVGLMEGGHRVRIVSRVYGHSPKEVSPTRGFYVIIHISTDII